VARPLQKLKNDLIYYLARALMAILVRLPHPWVSQLGRGFGALVFRLAGGERRKTLESLHTAFPDLSPKEAGKLGLASWKNIGRNLFETVHWMGWDREKIVALAVRVEGWENIEKALDRGKGAFVVTGHLGNWELLGGYLSSRCKGSAVAQQLYDSRFNEIINQFRVEKLGASAIIKRGLALRGILEALKENQLLLTLCDQDTGQDGVFVPFFGKLAWTQSGVARIAQKTGAALVPSFMVRGADGRFEAHIEKEIEIPSTGDREKDVVEATRRITEVVEKYVRAYPDQWVWMHQRWKTRPPGETKPN
jgi:Kdo2-lipid IVA lauroyltransferase/acyltransferase